MSLLRRKTNLVVRSIAVALLGVAAIGLAGCYERTIRQEGWGRSGDPVYEPNVPEPHDDQPRWKTNNSTSGRLSPRN